MNLLDEGSVATAEHSPCTSLGLGGGVCFLSVFGVLVFFFPSFYPGIYKKSLSILENQNKTKKLQKKAHLGQESWLGR